MVKVTFNLRVGMHDDELRNELQGRTSGETAQEVALLLQRDNHPLKAYRLEVLKVDTVHELALIRRNIRVDKLGGLSVYPFYYLTGVNDEGAYFVHELTRYGGAEWLEQVDADSNSLERLQMWLNRADEGFTRRIQGDILAQTISVALPPATPSGSRVYFDVRFGTRTLNFHAPALTSLSAKPQIINLGNHKVTADMIFEAYSQASYVLCLGAKVTLEHPQHARVEEPIQSGTGLLLAGQRARYVSVTVQSGQIHGFD